MVVALDAGFGRSDLVVQIPEHGVVLQQVSESLRVCEIVDRHEVYVRITDRGAINISSDASEPVDTNLNCHALKSSCRSGTPVPFLGLEMLRLWDRVSPLVNRSVKRGVL